MKKGSVHFSSKTDKWSTPQNTFDELNREFRFTIDVCASKKNAKCKRFFSQKQNGLLQSWKGERVFCNPPYGRSIGFWIQKMSEGKCKIAVGLIPARTDTKWFHKYILGKAEIRFIKGRLKFGNSKNSAPFPSMIVIFK